MNSNREIITSHLNAAKQYVASAEPLESHRSKLDLALHNANQSIKRISQRKKFVEWALPQAQPVVASKLYEQQLQMENDHGRLFDVTTMLEMAQKVLLAQLSLSRATNSDVIERLSRESAILASLRAQHESVVATLATLTDIIDTSRQRCEGLQAELRARQEELAALKVYMELRQGEKDLCETKMELATIQLQHNQNHFQVTSTQRLSEFEAAFASRQKWQRRFDSAERLIERRAVMTRIQELGNEIDTEATEPTWAADFSWPLKQTVFATDYSLDLDGYPGGSGVDAEIPVPHRGQLRTFTLSDMRIKVSPATSVELKRLNKPFAKGLYRSAYFSTIPPYRPKTVAKLFHLQRSIETDSEHALKVAKATMVADVFAKCFTDALKDLAFDARPIKARITIGYLSTTIAVHTRHKQVWMIEDMLDGWTKWSNNAEVARDDDYGRLLSAFTHYSFQSSGGRVLVTDNQGFCDESDPDHLIFRLTDPAVHTLSKDFEGLEHDLDANNGEEGRQAFVKSHKCSDWCRLLMLNATGTFI
ncbi:hypothetical protein HDU93_007500 [Gonapodya sp. JEL0774]|nr:hypothetical protein HDU93_007500 [Gonapodya sp. JEL0774]